MSLAAKKVPVNLVIPPRKRQRNRIVREVARRVLASAETAPAEAASATTPATESATERQVLAYATEIHSDFAPLLYRPVAAALPWLLKPLLGRASPRELLIAALSRREREKHLVVTGDVKTLRALARRGALIVAPTHASHLDSVAVGLALRREGLPRVLYGAGLNLFRNPILGFLLAGFGAYKVDRAKQDPLYKETLKQYVTLALEKGKHNLFFPGGTRSRDGAVEQRPKLGLLGCGLSAYISGLRSGRARADVFVVPVSLSHALVPEAEALVGERGAGGTKFAEPPFTRRLREWLRMETRIHVHLCPPLDVFGNAVDAEGVSRDAEGTPLDRRALVEENGEPVFRKDRDRDFTRALGAAVASSWLRHVTVLRTHVAACAAAEALREAQAAPRSVAFEEILQRVSGLLADLRTARAAGEIRLEEFLEAAGPEEVFASAHKVFDGYHGGNVLRFTDGRVYSNNTALLEFYGARVRQMADGKR